MGTSTDIRRHPHGEKRGRRPRRPIPSKGEKLNLFKVSVDKAAIDRQIMNDLVGMIMPGENKMVENYVPPKPIDSSNIPSTVIWTAKEGFKVGAEAPKQPRISFDEMIEAGQREKARLVQVVEDGTQFDVPKDIDDLLEEPHPSPEEEAKNQTTQAIFQAHDIEANGYHLYFEGPNLVCPAELNCTADFIADKLARFGVPGWDPAAPVKHGTTNMVYDPRTKVEAGYVTTTISADGLQIVNPTEEGHIFHDGSIIRTAKQKSGAWYVLTTGIGTNETDFQAAVNAWQGPLIFGFMDLLMKQDIANTMKDKRR